MHEGETTAASWYEATRVAGPERSRLNYDLDVDVCVVGAGLAGLTVAREVAQRGWSVAVLEAGRVAWAASGRNTGFVLPGFSENVDDMVERVGLDHTRQLWALSEQGVDYVRRTIEETGMPGVDPVPGWLHVSKTDNGDALRGAVERLRWIGADVEFWPTGRVREQLVNPRYFNAVHHRRAFHIHPLNYALGLAALAEKAGARIFEDTPAVALDAAGVRKRVVTPTARVRAAHVVLTGNVHLGALMPRLAATLLPVNTFVLVTEPLGPNLHDVIRYRGAVSDTNRADNHYRIVGGANSGGERLQWSGRMRAWAADPRWVKRGLVADIRRNFPALGPIEVAHLWRGTLGRTVHRMPQIGEIEQGVWLASGFGGHGLNTSAMGGELVARGIVDNDQTWRIFAPFELVWAGGKLGSIVAQGIYWGSRPIDRIEQGLARYREQARERKALRQKASNGHALSAVEAASVAVADPVFLPFSEPAAAPEPAMGMAPVEVVVQPHDEPTGAAIAAPPMEPAAATVVPPPAKSASKPRRRKPRKRKQPPVPSA